MKVKEVIEIVRFLLRIGPNVLWESDPLKVPTLEGEGSVTEGPGDPAKLSHQRQPLPSERKGVTGAVTPFVRPSTSFSGYLTASRISAVGCTLLRQ